MRLYGPGMYSSGNCGSKCSDVKRETEQKHDYRLCHTVDLIWRPTLRDRGVVEKARAPGRLQSRVNAQKLQRKGMENYSPGLFWDLTLLLQNKSESFNPPVSTRSRPQHQAKETRQNIQEREPHLSNSPAHPRNNLLFVSGRCNPVEVFQRTLCWHLVSKPPIVWTSN